MPTYDYKCSNDGCGHRFDALQSISEDPLEKCPACETRSLVRVITAGLPPIFKGSGFYETDYRHPRVPDQKKEDRR